MIDRRPSPPIAEAPEGRVATLTLTVLRHQPSPGRRGPYRVVCGDGLDEIDLVYFHAKGDWLEKLLPVGAVLVVSGRVERFQYRAQMAHPEHVVPEAEAAAIRIVEPSYPTTEGLPMRTLRRAIEGAL